jgi:hypothetical protein
VLEGEDEAGYGQPLNDRAMVILVVFLFAVAAAFWLAACQAGLGAPEPQAPAGLACGQAGAAADNCVDPGR